MTVIPLPIDAVLAPIALDLYRDIHKAIRVELFDVTAEAGRLDPTQGVARVALAAHVRDVVALLDSHAHHEDAAIQPVLEAELPELAERIERDHVTFEARTADLVEMAAEAAALDGADSRQRLHRVYLALAAFTGDYLAHQDVEERVVMPALQEVLGVEAIVGIHGAIVGSIPPEEMARSLSLMLPAMNVDDRTEMLGGMRAGAPAEVFEGIWGLTRSVLEPAGVVDLSQRLGLA